MKSITLSYTYQELGIKPEQLEKLMGFMPGDIPEPFSSVIREVISSAGSQTEITGGYLIFEDIAINPVNNTIVLEGQKFSPGRIIIRQMKDVRHAVVFLCTAGKGISSYAKDLLDKGAHVKAYALDVLGSLIVETAIEKIHNQIETEMKQKGMGVTNRFSPGFCGWNLQEQPKLFSLLPTGFCGIELSESSLMIPIKSVNGLIGIGINARRKEYSCHVCKDLNCIYRNKKP